MARPKGRGGYQRPSKPAAASGPGALSQRTDGRVPMIERTGLGYGDNKAVNDMQASAPLNPQQGGGQPQPQQQAGSPQPGGIFGGTRRPGEPMTAGIDFGPGAGSSRPVLPDDPNLFLKALYEQFPHPDIARMLQRLAQ